MPRPTPGRVRGGVAVHAATLVAVLCAAATAVAITPAASTPIDSHTSQLPTQGQGSALAGMDRAARVRAAMPADLRRRMHTSGSNLIAGASASSFTATAATTPADSRTVNAGAAPAPTATGYAVSPIPFGADPTGTKDSTAAVQKALAVCVNLTTVTTRYFPTGIRDGAGCTVDLEGGEYVISETLLIPAFTANLRIERGSLVASPQFPPAGTMVVVGGDQPCKVPQGSCNVDIGFAGLFLDGNRVAAGCLQINSVMGTTVGPQSYLLNFTGIGIQVNGGHEVMIAETWIGETNFDHKFTPADPPKAVGIQINSNDHYIADSIVFSALIGLQLNGAANYASGLHCWFPWNAAKSFNASAFQVKGSQNRFEGCYVDVSVAEVFSSASMFTWHAGFILGGNFVLAGGGQAVDRIVITETEFQGGSGAPFRLAPSDPSQPVSVTNSFIGHNLFHGPNAAGSRARATLSQTNASSWEFDLCASLSFPTITSVQFTVTATDGTFPTAVARAPTGGGCQVEVASQAPFSGRVDIEVDTVTYDGGFM